MGGETGQGNGIQVPTTTMSSCFDTACPDCRGCMKEGCKSKDCDMTKMAGEKRTQYMIENDDYWRCNCKAKKITGRIGIASMTLGGASGVTAIVLGALLGADKLNMGSFSFGEVNGFYFFVIVLAIAALATAVTGACFGNKTGTGLLIAAGVLALGSGGFGVAIGCGAELGKVAINDVSVATVTIIGFSALAITAFIWGLCCFKRKVICSRTARC